MAKRKDTTPDPPTQDDVIEQSPTETPEAQVNAAPVSTVKEYVLKQGECLVLRNGRDEAQAFTTTIGNWNSIYNAGKNSGNYTLLAEKKS